MQRIVRMDHIAWRKTVKTLHAKTGRSSLWIVWDMWRCAKRYGAGYSDYALFEILAEYKRCGIAKKDIVRATLKFSPAFLAKEILRRKKAAKRDIEKCFALANELGLKRNGGTNEFPFFNK